MTEKPDPTRPMDADTFDQWYWHKTELVAVCDALNLPRTGGKDALRARILTYLRTGRIVRPKRSARPTFNWAQATLTPETVITDPMSFGPNVRKFFGAQIGTRFVCHSDFMEWVRAHPGQTLADAVAAWHALEARKEDPAFRRDIAPHNNYLQYLRDYRDANPDHPIKAAKAAWQRRKSQPIAGDRIDYDASDAAAWARTCTPATRSSSDVSSAKS